MKRATSIQYPSTTITLASLKNRLRRTTSIPLGQLAQGARRLGSTSNALESEGRESEGRDSKSQAHAPPQRSSSGHQLAMSIRSSLSSKDSSLLDLTSTEVNEQRPAEAQELQWTIWSKALNDFDKFARDNPENLKTMVYNGIPLHFRPMAWQLLSGAHRSAYKERYSSLLKLDSPNEKLIHRDISRTYPDHPNFQENGPGRDCLFNVMKAYSLVDTEVGYCQGLCFIVGLLLMHVPEEDAFSIFCELMLNRKFGMRDLYKPGMAQLGLNIHLLSGMLQDKSPELLSHFKAQGLELNSFASSWFLTIFTTTFSIPCCSRILDCLLLDGPEIIFKVALSVLLTEKDKLMDLDMEDLLIYLSKEAPSFYEKDPSLLIQNAQTRNVSIHDRRSKRLEKEYFEKKSREARELAEMRRLRDSNELFKERIDALEKENANLTRRVATGKWTSAIAQKKEVKLKDEVSVLQNETDRLRQKLKEYADKENLLHISVAVPKNPTTTTTTTNEIISASSNSLLVRRHSDSSRKSSCSSFEVSHHGNAPSSQDNFVLQLQEELVAARLREACLDERVKELEAKNQDAEKRISELDTNKQLIQSQQEVVKIKIRFAEMQNAYRELQIRFDMLEKTVISSRENSGQKRGGSVRTRIKSSTAGIGIMNSCEYSLTREALLHQELIDIRLQEAKLAVENKDKAMKIIELQQWCDHLNEQITRNSSENTDLKFKLQEMEKDQIEKESLGDLHRVRSGIRSSTRLEKLSRRERKGSKSTWMTAKDILSTKRTPERKETEGDLGETKI